MTGITEIKRTPALQLNPYYWRDALAGYLLIAPNMLVFAIWLLLPVMFVTVLSFTDWNFQTGLGGIRFIGASNFSEMLRDVWFVQSLRNTLGFTASVVPLSIGLGLLFAVIMDQGVFMAPIIRTMLFMPYITSSVAIAAVWLSMFHPRSGPINMVLYSLGVRDLPKWLGSSDWALPALIIVAVWGAVGYNATVFTAGLQNIPDELMEAAAIDGADGRERFWYITLPLLSPTTLFLLITGIISSFNAFELVAVMTQGGPGTSTTVLAYHIYRTGFTFYRMGYASAVALVLLVIVFVITLIQVRIQRSFAAYM